MTGEWTVRPVHKNDGTVWPGIGYISDGKRTYGSANFEEGKAIVAAINAALAAEQETIKNLRIEAQQYKRQLAAAQVAIQARNEQDYTAAINEALNAERDWIAKFCGYDEKGALDAYVAKQLTAEREKHKILAHAFESERDLRKRYEDALTTVAQWDEYAKDALAKLNLKHEKR